VAARLPGAHRGVVTSVECHPKGEAMMLSSDSTGIVKVWVAP